MRVATGRACLALLMPALLLAMPVQPARPGAPAQAYNGGQEPRPAPARTMKERLGDKASDEQRVDNCKVPPALRGPKPRPDDCPHLSRPASGR